MHTATLNTPRTTQSAAPSTQALTPNEGVNTEPKLVLMSWAEWAATPKDYRLEKGTQRWVMRAHPAGGVGLFPVHITG
ncbi:MAG: hypothetical protein KGL33_06110 [Betaproteobacteria bacterium]|jgi:hypothetical protein|uniref:hypothetical protein n=1 Tax=Thiomonas TaxID=32012 RepID=UPI0023A6F22E|nr:MULTISPECIES: hypothetical protein [Thiomonas]MDE2268572.1 hypothetical protein [Betaproteobacteria bacterium]HML81973.1 hypothetical protein [Thiomonas arsenitoxydans]